MSSLLTKSEAQGVLLASLFERFLDITGDTVEAIGGTGAAYPLVGTLMVVVGDPVGKALAGVGEGGKEGILKKLFPDGAPEALDLAECHRVVRGAADVLNSLAAEHLLELRLPSPGDELPPVVGENLPGRSPLAYCAFHHFQDSVGCLLPEEAVAHDVSRMIIDDSHQVDPEHSLELESKDIDLPQGVRDLPLEATHLRVTGFRWWRRIAEVGVVDYSTHCFRRHLEPLVPPQLVADPPHPHLGVGTTELLDA